MKPELTFIMCSYNEIGRIEESYNDLVESMKNRTEKVEVLFIDNGSTDGTREWLESIENPDVRLIFNEVNLGKGGSIKKGISISNGEYVVIHDPDFEYRAADVWKCYDHAIKTDAAFVLGSRVLSKEIKYKYVINYLGVKLLTSFINLLYGCRLTDTATAMKLLKGDVIRGLRLNCNSFDLDFELVTRVARSGGSIVEVSAEYYPRTVDEGKKIRAFHDGIMSLKLILKDRFASRRSITK